MRIFICDQCKKEFSQPLDEERYMDEHGVVHAFDLCATCRLGLKENKDKPMKEYFDKILKEK